jgi:CHAD domain-containing protein
MVTGEPPAGDGPGEGTAQRNPWRKSRLPSLAPSTTAEEALADIVLSCADHLRGNQRCVLERSHEEGIHQMRVAVRRLRSCVSLYERFIPEEQQAYLSGELKWLIKELGPARDWDVFVGEIMSPVVRQMPGEERLEALSQRVEQLRDEAYARAQAAVGSHRYIGLVLLLTSWAEGRGWRGPAQNEHPMSMVKASEVAHDLLRGIYEGVTAAGANFEHLNPRERHKVRIHLKQLRYATEFFSTLYSKRKVTPYLSAMKSLQDQLGASNDVDVARKLLQRAVKGTRGKERASLSYAAGIVIGWHSHIGDDRERELVAAWQRLVARPPYWEPAAAPGPVTAAPDVGKAAAEAPEAAEEQEAVPPAATGTAIPEQTGITVTTSPGGNRRAIRRT